MMTTWDNIIIMTSWPTNNNQKKENKSTPTKAKNKCRRLYKSAFSILFLKVSCHIFAFWGKKQQSPRSFFPPRIGALQKKPLAVAAFRKCFYLPSVPLFIHSFSFMRSNKHHPLQDAWQAGKPYVVWYGTVVYVEVLIRTKLRLLVYCLLFTASVLHYYSIIIY